MAAFFNSKPGTKDRKGRIEGRAKVTGAALYSAEYDVPELLHGVFVGSSIASGKITALHTANSLAVPGVRDVLSFFNKPDMPAFSTAEKIKETRIAYPVFYTDEIKYSDQIISLVVAENIEDARYAASLITAEYVENSDFKTDFDALQASTTLTNKGTRGSATAWENSAHTVDETYEIAMEVHNPMELFATIAIWEDDQHLKLYDKNQGVNNVQGMFARCFGIPKENIHVITEYMGGGFGAGLNSWPHAVAVAIAAKLLKQPVKAELTRPQMFTQVGHRPESWQRIRLGADASGIFTGAINQAKNVSSEVMKFEEGITRVSKKLYGFENLQTDEAIVTLQLPAPTWMRGPGDSTGCFAMESAIDELCAKAGFDPVEVRLKNIAPKEMETGNPWSSHFLNECIEQGAEKIGWQNRPKSPGTLSRDGWKIGYGHAVGLWNARRSKTSAYIELNENGKFTVACAMTDIGTGTYEAALNLVHMETGIPKELISVRLGDSDLPPAPSQGGSTGLASLSGAITAASKEFKALIAEKAWNDKSAADSIKFNSSGITKTDGSAGISYTDLLRKSGGVIRAEATSESGEETKQYGFVSSAAHFCIVKVHEITGRIKVERFVSVVDGGTIINDQAAANQIIGAVAGGIGMTLMEKQAIDHRYGRLIGNDFAGYHVPVNASVPMVEVAFINKLDPHLNATGSKGIGEVGIIGNAAAICNAIYNATGKRYRKLPVTPEVLMV